jgi:hypothetical protein
MPTEFSCRAAAAHLEYVSRQRFFCAPGSRAYFFFYDYWAEKCVSFLFHN